MAKSIKSTDIDAHVSRRFRELRKAGGMTQQRLAAKVGVSWQQIQKYDSGQNRISAGRLYAIARALGVPVQDFFPQE